MLKEMVNGIGMKSKAMRKGNIYKELLLSSLIFLIAFLPRFYLLGTFMMYDGPYWIVRSYNFISALLSHDWAGTFITSHPGVTTMWVSGISVWFKYLSVGVATSENILPYIFHAKFPIALITSIGCVILYFLVKRIFNEKIAIISALLIALDPYYLAHSRVIHLDALLATFMTLSVLCLIIHQNYLERRYLILSAIFAGLAFLTKLPSIILVPFIVISLFLSVHSLELGNLSNRVKLIQLVKNILIYFSIAAIVFVVLWPAMWVDPVHTVYKLGTGVYYNVTHFHVGGGYFMGEIMHSVNPFYYPVTLLLRLTPVSSIFSVLAIIFFSFGALKIKKPEYISDRDYKNIGILLLYIVLFFSVMMTGSKQMLRYLLPIFLVIDILAAIGIYYVIYGIISRINKNKGFNLAPKTKWFTIFFVIIILFQAFSSLPLCPYYRSYYNPMLGGSEKAPWITSIGGGEGMSLAADYLNGKENAENLTVAVQHPGFEPYFKGTTIGMSNASSADYIVFHHSVVQCGRDKDIWERYKNEIPERIITINNINHCWIYKTKVEVNK